MTNEDRRAFTPEVRERLMEYAAASERLAKRHGGVTPKATDIRSCLQYIDTLEARRNELVASLSTLDAWEKIKLLERAEQAEEREAALEARVADTVRRFGVASGCRFIPAERITDVVEHAIATLASRATKAEARVSVLELTGNPNAANCDGLPNTPHAPIAIIMGQPCPACVALARVAVLSAALKNLHATTLAWAEKPHTAQDTADWMKAMQDAAGALEGGKP